VDLGEIMNCKCSNILDPEELERNANEIQERMLREQQRGYFDNLDELRCDLKGVRIKQVIQEQIYYMHKRLVWVEAACIVTVGLLIGHIVFKWF
jgi:hypothetical protein